MQPILLIHGYSAESKMISATDVVSIYGSLPNDLRRAYGNPTVFELDVSRYISLSDGITLDDVATAMDQALHAQFPQLLEQPFNVIIHSTGALVVRNWLRLFSKKPSSINHIIYLAAANFGSGWAHIGKGQLAKWARFIFQRGGERGVQVLNALEFGSNETLDMHRYFLEEKGHMYRRYKIREFCIVGSQVMSSWLPIPVRFAHEDGSDGVVRVSSCNLNMNYVSIKPIQRAHDINWETLSEYCELLADRVHDDPDEYYRVNEQYLSDGNDRPPIPLAIPYQCAHSGDEMGIVRGVDVRKELLELLDIALNVKTEQQYKNADAVYTLRTQQNYQRAASDLRHRFFQGLRNEPRQQYDPHAQLIFRLRDQYNQPIEHYDVFFDTSDDSNFSINQIFEHTHTNNRNPGIVTYYLRLASFDHQSLLWEDKLKQLSTVHLEVAPTEPQSRDIGYLPLHMTISGDRLRRFIQPHRTTIIDIQLLRIPSPNVFSIFPVGDV